MNEGYYLLTNSILYNQKSLHLIDFSEEVNALITICEDMDVVDNVLELGQGLLTISVGLIESGIHPDNQTVLIDTLSKLNSIQRWCYSCRNSLRRGDIRF